LVVASWAYGKVCCWSAVLSIHAVKFAWLFLTLISGELLFVIATSIMCKWCLCITWVCHEVCDLHGRNCKDEGLWASTYMGWHYC
jgi:hypothetical protein